MTDREVNNAFDVLKSWQRLAYHNDDGTDEDSHELYEALTLMFDHINRQKAENERLREDSKRLKKVQMQLDDLCIMNNIIRAEAIKEFSEKAKPILDELVDLLFDDNESNCIVVGCNKPSSIGCNCAICVEENKKVWRGKIDNLVKEMVGDNNG